MSNRVLLSAGCVLLSVVLAFAQGGGATGDPVTGKWGMDGVTFLELQFDGKRSVSGTATWRHGGGYEERATIAAGSFDRETGALTLTGEVKNPEGEVVRYRIEGTIEKDVVAGTFSVGDQKGDFRFVRQ